MKLHVLSGLHLQFGGLHPPRTDADVVVLAGDIGRGLAGLRWAAGSFDKPVIYVPGNCELHDFDLCAVEDLRRQAEAMGILLLHQDELSLEGIRFLGCTMWTDYELLGMEHRAEAMHLADSWVDDFQLMTDGGERFTPERARTRHWLSRDWLAGRLTDSARAVPTVVVTHHAPTPNCLAERYRDELIAASHASDLSELIGLCDLWIHGTGRGRSDELVHGTQVVSNSRGAPTEHEIFDGRSPFLPGFTVEVPVSSKETQP